MMILEQCVSTKFVSNPPAIDVFVFNKRQLSILAYSLELSFPLQRINAEITNSWRQVYYHMVIGSE